MDCALGDLLVCLYVAVILFRTFEVEGYIISTGSMAPALLGYHKRVVCPSCGYPFALGISVDATGNADESKRPFTPFGSVGAHRQAEARCPNCGRDAIDVRNIPPNHGDQLLVLKNVYDLRPPHRWEILVLKGPVRPNPPFVKRVVGLPNEAVQIIDGDIYADGKICRKDFAQQRAIRIPVFDNAYRPCDAADGQDCWKPEPAASWQPKGAGFACSAADAASKSHAEQTAWLEFRHWERRAGTRKAPADAGSPVTDIYGYNGTAAGLISLPVRDLMLECDVAATAGAGELTFEMGDSPDTYRLTFDRSKEQVRLSRSHSTTPLRIADFPSSRFDQPFKVELSNFDREVSAAVDGVLLFAPWECETRGGRLPPTPVRIGSRGLSVELSALKLYRDIYYTRGAGRNAVDRPIVLGADEYFVLGDNSPVSSDARGWPNGAVKQSQLIGKPLCVHLPSRPAPVILGGKTRYIRIPDFSRMRYIR